MRGGRWKQDLCHSCKPSWSFAPSKGQEKSLCRFYWNVKFSEQSCRQTIWKNIYKFIRICFSHFYPVAFLVRVMSVKFLCLRKAWEAKECLRPAVANVATGSQLLPGCNMPRNTQVTGFLDGFGLNIPWPYLCFAKLPTNWIQLRSRFLEWNIDIEYQKISKHVQMYMYRFCRNSLKHCKRYGEYDGYGWM